MTACSCLLKSGKALCVTGLALAGLVVWFVLLLTYLKDQFRTDKGWKQAVMGVMIALAAPLSIAILWSRHMLVACCTKESRCYGLFVIGATALIEIFMLLLAVVGEFLEQTVMQSFTLLFLAAVITYQGLTDPLYTHNDRLAWADSRWGMLCMLLSAVEFFSVLAGNEHELLAKVLFMTSVVSIAMFLVAAVWYFLLILRGANEVEVVVASGAKVVV